jgi:YD repeat-containing protein
MPQSLSVSKQPDDWRDVRDDVRGTRQIRFEGPLPAEAWLASGEHLAFAHDGEGRLRALDLDGAPLLRIDRLPGKSRTVTRFGKDGVVTELRLRNDGSKRTLITGDARLDFRFDRQGRIVRAVLPGSSAPLEYRWTDGSCSIGPAGGPLLLTITPAEDRAMRITLHGSGASWDETLPLLGAQTIGVRDGNGQALAECRIEVDALHRPTARTWSDGDADRWPRDDQGRLASWTRTRGGTSVERTYTYDEAGDLAEEREGDTVWLRETDSGHRVTALVRPDGTRTEYRYDAAGRRVSRTDGADTTAYTYDAFGQLTAAGEIRSTYDGLGRRISVATPHGRVSEHRDSGGRLWAVTDARGRALHTFLWFGGRMVARIDGDTGGPVAEGYVTDGGGTLLGIVDADGGFERIDASPFGTIAGTMRPSLYGHVGDPGTGLIHFGARDLDPELGLFLTPDPWDGAPDDPRLWEGLDPAELAASAELPAATRHPYAVCHFDPVGRTDIDGHYVDGWGIVRTILLGPTWGAPLTSISLFFFLPFDIYFELIGDLVFLITRICADGWTTPWANHHLWKLIGGAASAHQGLVALGLNGLLPRVVSGGGFSSNRAVTIGHVIWINRDELDELDPKRLLELWDISGSFNSNPATASIVAVTGTEDGTSRLHVSRWTRGFGNSVADVPGTLPVQYKFDDTLVGGATVARGALVLLNAFPEDDFPYAEDSDSDASMKVEEYLFPAGGKRARATLTMVTGIRVGPSLNPVLAEILEVAAPGAPFTAAAFVEIIDIQSVDATGQTLLLDPALPAALTTGLNVKRIIVDAPAYSSGGWTQSGGAGALETPASTANWPPPITVGEVYAITGGPAPSHAHATQVDVTLDLQFPAGAVPDMGAAVNLLTADGAPFGGNVPAAAQPAHVLLDAGHPVMNVGDLLRISAGTSDALVRVTAVDASGNEIDVAPDLTTLPLNSGGATLLLLQRYVNGNLLDAGVINGVTGNSITAVSPRANVFSVGSFVAFPSGGTRTLGRVSVIPKVKLTLSHSVGGPASTAYTIARMRIDSTFDLTGIATTVQAQLIKHAGGDLPSTFSPWPGAILGVSPNLPPTVRDVFYVNNGTSDPAFFPTWQSRTAGTDEFWLFNPPLPFETDGTKWFWRVNPEWRVSIGTVAPTTIELREFATSGTVRVDGGDNRVFAVPAEVQFPERPQDHHSYRRALIEHELHHAVQNSKWGPLMTALPITGLLNSAELLTTAGGGTSNWLKWLVTEGAGWESQGLGWAQVLSMGGLMELAWKYLYLSPRVFSPAARDAVAATKIDFWQKIFNPLLGLLQSRLPELSPDLPAGQRWKSALLHLFATAFDLRSWVPIIGLVPGLLPDGPRNFLEQQASRASGDLYSTLLSADDHFNHLTEFRGGAFTSTVTDADRSKLLGDSTRLMMWCDSRINRFFAAGDADTRVRPLISFVTSAENESEPIFRIEPQAAFTNANPALLHAALYEPVPITADAPPATVPATVILDGPNGDTASFYVATSAHDLQPRLRAFVPTPPRVTRSTGFHFIPGSPGAYQIFAYYQNDVNQRLGQTVAPDQFANTERATITVGAGQVTLGGRVINWVVPAASGTGTTALPAFDMFLTEALVLSGLATDNTHYAAVFLPAPAPAFTIAPSGGNAWLVEAAETFPANAADRIAHIRLFRVYAADDSAFGLPYDSDDTPTLANVRSYLKDPVWIPLRDFTVTLQDLPALSPATIPASQTFDLDLPIAVRSANSIVITPAPGAPALPLIRVGVSPTQPRGELWRLGPPSAPITATTTYTITVTFGTPPKNADRTFALTYTP